MRLDITITDAQKDARNLDFLCAALRFTGIHGASVETKMQFLKRKLLEFIKQHVRQGYSEALGEAEIPTE